MGFIHGDYPLLPIRGVDDHDHMEGSLPVDQQQQLLQDTRLECAFEFAERAVDQPQLVESMLADPLRKLPDLSTRSGSHPPIIASAAFLVKDLSHSSSRVRCPGQPSVFGYQR